MFILAKHPITRPTIYYRALCYMKSIKQRQILYDLTCMWNLNKQTKCIDTEQTGGNQRRGVGQWGKWVKVVRRYKFPVISPGDVMDSVVTIVNNTTLYTESC